VHFGIDFSGCWLDWGKSGRIISIFYVFGPSLILKIQDKNIRKYQEVPTEQK
jgi:hypothetical protein